MKHRVMSLKFFIYQEQAVTSIEVRQDSTEQTKQHQQRHLLCLMYITRYHTNNVDWHSSSFPVYFLSYSHQPTCLFSIGIHEHYWR